MNPVRLSKKNKKGKLPAWDLRLYVANQTPRSRVALANLENLCEEHLKGQYRIKVIDLLKNPGLAKEDGIVAIPTLIRKFASHSKRVIGDLSNTKRVLEGLDVPQNA